MIDLKYGINSDEIKKKLLDIQKSAKSATSKMIRDFDGVDGAVARLAAAFRSLGLSTRAATIAAQAFMSALTMGAAVAITAAISWVMKLIDKYQAAKSAAVEFANAQKAAIEEYAKTVASKITGTLTKFESLRQEYNALGDNLNAKKRFIDENAKAFKDLGVNVTTVTDADNLFINNAEAFVKSIEARARAAAAMDLAAEDYKAAIMKMIEAENISVGFRNNKIISSGLTYEQQQELPNIYKNAASRYRVANRYLDSKTLNEGAAAAGQKAVEDYVESIKKGITDGAQKALNEGTRKIQTSTKITDSSKNLLKSAGIKEYDNTKTKQQDDKNAEREAKKQAEVAKRLADEIRSVDLSLEQSRINIMKDGTEKRIAQINLNTQKELKALEERRSKLKELDKQDTTSERYNAGQAMLSAFNGNVDLLARPLIDAAELVKKGWEDAGEGIATVFSSQYGIADAEGNIHEILVTPILPNGEVLSPEEFESYIYDTLENSTDILKADTKGIVIGIDVTEDGSAGEYLHQIQEQYYEPYIKLEEERQNVLAKGSQQIEDIRDRETQAEIQALNEYLAKYGDYQEKRLAISELYAEKIAKAETEGEKLSLEQDMKKALAEFDSNQFKQLIDWESVFGDLSKQATSSLQVNLNRIREYFEANKDSMSVQDIKEYQEAIANMEDEIASRNPFAAMHKSITDIGNAKTELVDALASWKAAQDELEESQRMYNEAIQERNDILAQIESGKLAEDSEELVAANDKLQQSEANVAKAREKNIVAEQRVVKARNGLTNSYTKFSAALKGTGAVITDIGGKAKNLASVFSDDVAAGMDKAIGFIDEVMNATADVIDEIGKVGKSVAGGVEKAVEAAAAGSTAAATAGATSIGMIEKASVILTVISAALQIATAIANLFNDDESKQAEIERLQERIDQLQWELDNADTVRLQEKVGDAVEKLRNIYAQTTQEVLRLRLSTQQYATTWGRYIGSLIYQNEIARKSIEKIADAYGNVAYTADKALGEDKYANSRKQLENLAEQQLLIQKQIEEENSKKDTDDSWIKDREREIQEIAGEMATVINEMLEEVVGYTAEDLASELGRAFFEAAKQGEDAMEAWHAKVKDIVADIIQRMLITKFLEPQIGEIFDKYKAKWFPDGNGEGAINRIIESANDFANDLNAAANGFGAMYESLSDGLKDYFSSDSLSAQTATQRGFQAISQETGDELNGRFTAIQGDVHDIREFVMTVTSQISEQLNQTINIRDIMIQLNGNVGDIRTYTRVLPDMKDTLDSMNRKLDNL